MNKIPFKRFGTQIDCSRNAVMSVDALKRWIDITSAMGHNTLMLYTEDTYEIDGHPYFGYGRGRFSHEELKELDAYALEHGMELIASIQTLAHIKTAFRWKHYAAINDCEDILLCEDERTYELIDSMLKTVSECYTSRTVCVGMDEADMLGRGKYYDAHGDTKRIDIILRHMQKVSEIAKKYGLEILIYSDMLYRLATHAEYSDESAKVQEDITHLIPDNLGLIYWNYYKRSVEDYSAIMNVHKEIKKDNLWYFGGSWADHSFSPENSYCISAYKNNIQACLDTGIENVILSVWGDDGAECGKFATLPSIFYATELAKGNKDEALIKENFEKMFGIPFDKFMLVDLTERNETEEYGRQPSRYLLFNDLFIGLFDTTIPDYAGKDHEELVKLLAPLRKNEEWGFLFDNLYWLCKVIALKWNMGIRIREAYKTNDKKELANIVTDIRKLKKLVHKFYLSLRRQWMIENKPHGFDVSDIRIGGLETRIGHCGDRLQDYIDGKIDRIEELEVELLDIRAINNPTYGVKKYLNYWETVRYYADMVSVNAVGKGY